jgi:hypothetical protein
MRTDARQGNLGVTERDPVDRLPMEIGGVGVTSPAPLSAISGRPLMWSSTALCASVPGVVTPARAWSGRALTFDRGSYECTALDRSDGFMCRENTRLPDRRRDAVPFEVGPQI